MEVGTTASTPIANVLILHPTTGAKTNVSSIWDPPGAKFDNEEFFHLLLGSIQQSGLFREVTTEPPGDYELRSEIIFQETVPALSSTFLLLIRYELIDVSAQEVIWKENLYSQKDFSAKQAFSGGHNVVLLMEEAYIANLQELIHRLRPVMAEAER
jgi:hypothetical protein